MRRFISFGVLLLLLGTSVIWWYHHHASAAVTAIASSGGARLELPAREEIPHYLQSDPRWGSDAIGGSGESLSAVGCTITSVAMAAEALGYTINPGELNTRLTEEGGYTSRGWLIWSKVSAATEGKITVRVPSRLTHAQIDQALQNGDIPVVKFFLLWGVSHWVPILGKSGEAYLIRDPLDTSQKIVPLSTKTNTIFSVRYVRKS